MTVEESERTALYLVVASLFLVLVSGFFSLFLRAGVERLDLTGSMFFIFTLTVVTVSLIISFKNARYAAAFAAIALLLATIVFGSCVLGWSIFSVTC